MGTFHTAGGSPIWGRFQRQIPPTEPFTGNRWSAATPQLKALGMRLGDLISRLTELRGESEPAELLRMGLLICNRNADLAKFEQSEVLEREYREITFQLQAATDQHGAVAEELDALASTEPCHFSPDHLWTLIRAIKVQNQILQMYLGPADVTADL